MKPFLSFYMTIILLLFLTNNALSQTFDEKFEHWPTNFKINGTIIAANNLVDSGEVDSLFFRIIKGADARVVVILSIPGAELG